MATINSSKGMKLSPTDEFKLKKAAQLLQEQSVVNPYDEVIKKAQADYEALKAKSDSSIQ
jgi:hypothetical protein